MIKKPLSLAKVKLGDSRLETPDWHQVSITHSRETMPQEKIQKKEPEMRGKLMKSRKLRTLTQNAEMSERNWSAGKLEAGPCRGEVIPD